MGNYAIEMGQISLRNITKVYNTGKDNEIVGVDDLSIDAGDGEFLVLVGPSGCGKSTTLRCIAGLESVSSGDVMIGDEVVNDLSPKERDIAMVFQNYALYPHMSARDNISFALRMNSDFSKDEIDERVEEIATMMGIETLLQNKPGELSGGQQQRVALGRALIQKPSVFLLDEPLSNLDAKLRTRMRAELQEIQNELGVTTVYVTHDQTEAMTMADKIAVLNGGELQQLGTPLECYFEPNNQFVAGFIGEPSMNFFETTVEGTRLRGEAIEYELSESLRSTLGETTDLVLGIRPEDITVAEKSGGQTVTATIQVVEPLGDTNYVHATVGSHEITVQLPNEDYVDVGSEVEFEFPIEKIHLFDARSGDAIANRQVEPGFDYRAASAKS